MFKWVILFIEENWKLNKNSMQYSILKNIKHNTNVIEACLSENIQECHTTSSWHMAPCDKFRNWRNYNPDITNFKKNYLLSKNLLQHNLFSLIESGSVSQNTSRKQQEFLQLNPDKMNEWIIDFTILTDGGSRKKNLDFITIPVLVRIPNEPHQVHSSMRIIGCFSCSFPVQLFLSSSSFADKKFFVDIMLPISSGAM